VFCEATVFFVLVDSPVEDLREELVLSDSSVVVVEPEWWEPEAREPEAWGPEALEPGARESRLGAWETWLGAIPEVGLLIGGARC
jgi:hypothetical protein